MTLLAGCAEPQEAGPPEATPATPTAQPSPGAPTAPGSPGAPTATPTGPTTDPAPTPPERDPDAPLIRLDVFVDGFSKPLLVTHAGDGSGRVFVVEQGGRVWIVDDGTRQDTPFLDLADRTRAEGEQGLLGLAFAPDFAQSGVLYASYTDLDGDSVLARYRLATGERDRVDATTEEVLLRVEQPYANHNGGHIAFGPDGYLYLGLGDGGSGGDPHGHGQDPRTLLGSLLRLDVAAEGGYRIPPDNPYADGERGAPEMWATGLRNPWRWSFDRETRDLYIADVGQGAREEINVEPAGSGGGLNYGWSTWEGTQLFSGGSDPHSDVVFPVHEYETSGERCAITGGYVYRGEAIPTLRGVFLFSDYCGGTVHGLARVDSEWRAAVLAASDARVTSFGEDEAGELYVVDHAGRVLRVVDGGGPLPQALR